MNIPRFGARAALATAALAAVLVTGKPAAAVDPTFNFEVKGQIYSETTDLRKRRRPPGNADGHPLPASPPGRHRHAGRHLRLQVPDVRRLRHVQAGLPRLRDDVAGRRRERPRHPDHRRLRHRQLLREAELQDRPHEDAPDACEPGRLLRTALAGPVDVRLQRLRHLARQVQPRPRRRGLGRFPRRQAPLLRGRLPGTRGALQGDQPAERRGRHLIARALEQPANTSVASTTPSSTPSPDRATRGRTSEIRRS